MAFRIFLLLVAVLCYGALPHTTAITDEDLLKTISEASAQGLVDFVNAHRVQIKDELITKKLCSTAVKREGHSGPVISWLIHTGHLAFLQACLAQGTDTEITDELGNTPLISAIAGHVLRQTINSSGTRENFEKMAEMLISAGAKVNTKDREGDSPLCRYLGGLQPSLLRSLIKSGADVHENCRSGRTLLYIALQNEKEPELLSILLEAGADPTKAALNGTYDYLSAAIWRHNNAQARLLLQYGANPNVACLGDIALRYAVTRGNDEGAALLVEFGAELPPLQAIRNMRFEKEYPLTMEQLRRRLSSSSSDMWKLMRECIDDSDTQTIEWIKPEKALLSTMVEGKTLLHLAVDRQDPAVIKSLCDLGADVGAVDKRGMTPIHTAVVANCGKCLNIMLPFADPETLDKKNKAGTSALMAAVGNLKLNIAKALLDLGADINTTNKKGNTPLHIAILTRKQSLLDLLIEYSGINFNAENEKGQTPLSLAQEQDGGEWFENLRKKFPNLRNALGETALHSAVFKNDLGEVKRLSHVSGMEVNARDGVGFQASNIAIDLKSVDAVKTLLEEARVDPNAEIEGIGQTLLHEAVLTGDEQIMKELADWPGTNIDVANAMGETPLHLAIKEKANHLIPMLLHRQANPNAKTQGLTALHLALKIGNDEAARLLIDNFFTDVGIRDGSGNTAFQIACLKGKFDLAESMVKNKGANVNVQNGAGVTMLHWAANKKDHDLVAMLLGIGAQVDIQDKKGLTALTYAIRKGDVRGVEILLEAGARVDLHDKQDETPLHEAVYADLAVLERLKSLRGNADWNVTNEKGNTPLHLAAQLGNEEKVRLLLQIPTIDHQILNGIKATASMVAKNSGFSYLASLIEAHSLDTGPM